ncbi:TerB family tellurite resistance protein [Sandaracinus amylolyticus]|uniref:Co-chaperone DjlA N-terminal domain-containing protein n=1 Tax=Sandaracinus amylolyticus TaxID=927083 RepID=A0A0F6W9G7_9BACT|nr:TerB family tellurite resistance protein [Sandaracinus amylolyticus]AKF10765.1 hypothetical protein DB32_007914 [Sandaracinus amylolyticus]
MELRDLTNDETVCLMGLLREVIQADDDYSPAERAKMRELRDALGDERFDAAIDEAKRRYAGSRAALKEHAKTITRPEARRAMYALLERVAASDGVTASEKKPLDWVASWWDLKT